MTSLPEIAGMTTIPTSGIDPDVLRRAFSDRDTAALLALYADDATVELVDNLHQPSAPRCLRGREELRAHLNDAFARDMTHVVDIVAAAPDALGYVLRCTYPDGTKVVCAATADVRDGRIVREIGVQAWDA
jgi:ketosteroid isomerase-like protein